MADRVRPSTEQVVRRLVILQSVYAAGYFVPPADVVEGLRTSKPAAEFLEILGVAQGYFDKRWDPMREEPLWGDLSLDEREFMVTPVEKVTERQLTDAFWRIESAQALMWCLGMIESIPPYDTRANDAILRTPSFDVAKIFSDGKLRSASAIDAAREEAELWHWRSRTRELIESGTFPADHPMFSDQPYDSLDGIVRLVARKLGEETPSKPTIHEDFAARGKAYRDLTDAEWRDVRSITIERHLALNWVCGYAENNRWELTPTGT